LVIWEIGTDVLTVAKRVLGGLGTVLERRREFSVDFEGAGLMELEHMKEK